MGLISIPGLQVILRSHATRFAQIVWPIWEKYEELPDSHRLAYDPTTEANMLHSYMVQAAKVEFNNVPGVQFLERNGFHLGIDGSGYGIDGLAVCRLKKLNEDGTSSNYPTDRAEALRRNEDLPGMPEHATYVDIGYVLNALHTAIRDVQAVRIHDSQLIFSIPQSGQVTQITDSLNFGPMVVEPRFALLNGKAKRKTDGTKDR